MIAPRICARLDRDEAVAALVVGEAPAGAGEVGVERRGVIVPRVDIATGGVRLPDLDQGAAHRPSVGVGDPAAQDYPLAQRLTRMLPRQVGIFRANGNPAKRRSTCVVEPLVGQAHGLVARCTQARRAVVRKQVGRLEIQLRRHP